MEKITNDEFKVTLRNDYAFKRAFGDEKNKVAVIDFLSCVLDIPIEEIADIQFLDKELPKDYFSDKTGILDIKILLNLKLKNKTEIGIEIQNVWADGFDRRLLFYWAKMYINNFRIGEPYTKLKNCVIISLVGKGFNLNEQIHSTYKLLETNTHKKLNDAIEIHFLDLTKAKQTKMKSSKNEEKVINWLKFIETDNKEERAMLSQNSLALKTMNDTMEYIGQDPAERRRYLSHMLLKCDIVTLNEFNLKKGEKIGYKKASKEIAKAKAETSKAKDETKKAKAETNKVKTELVESIAGAIKRMKLKGFAVEEIADLMNISIEEVKTY